MKREGAIVAELQKRWLSNEEAQKYLGVSARTLHSFRKSGKLKYYSTNTGKGRCIIWYDVRHLDKLVEGFGCAL